MTIADVAVFARVIDGDCRKALALLPDGSVDCVVTSPPYFGLRDYGHEGQMGLEKTPEAYVAELVAVFRGVRRTLRPGGIVWLVLGDSYAGSWGNQGRKSERGSQRPINGPMLQKFEKHAVGCDMGDDCKCGAGYAQRESHTGSWVNDHPTLKPKDLIGIPWRVALALQADGWWLRMDVVWHKPNPMPSSVTDRPTNAHEYVFMLTKSARYYYDAAAIAEPAVGQNHHDLTGTGYKAPGQPKNTGNRKALRNATESRHRSSVPGGQDLRADPTPTRNARSVWTVATSPFRGAHFATFPPLLAEKCILAGCPPGGTVLDPFGGSGTTGLVANRLGRNAILIELNPGYAEMARKRIAEGVAAQA